MRSLLVLAAASAAALAQSAAPASQVPAFKESGSVMAPITIELYTDFQCPHCRAFYLDVLPQLTNDFIKTAKVRLIHRDFPLSQFQYSRTAMHFANAAGQIGKYDAVSQQLFESQPEWSQTGDVEAAVAKVLTPSELARVKTIIRTDTHLDDSVNRDVQMATEVDHVMSTPGIVIVYRGKRETINGAPTYANLKAYLNSKL